MQSPFPGVDPFIECQEWDDFHSRFNNLLADLLAPQIELYSWSLSAPLPTIPIPFKLGDADTLLDLRQAFSEVYQRARYDLSIDYHQPLAPLLADADRAWVAGLVNRSTKGRMSTRQT